MPEIVHSPGKTTIAPEVLVSIARLTTLNVVGVSRLVPQPQEVGNLFAKGNHEGVKIFVESNTVYVDLYVVIKRDHNIRDVSRVIQTQVARAISEMIGMEVGKVNIHIEDIDYSEASA